MPLMSSVFIPVSTQPNPSGGPTLRGIPFSVEEFTPRSYEETNLIGFEINEPFNAKTLHQDAQMDPNFTLTSARTGITYQVASDPQMTIDGTGVRLTLTGWSFDGQYIYYRIGSLPGVTVMRGDSDDETFVRPGWWY